MTNAVTNNETKKFVNNVNTLISETIDKLPTHRYCSLGPTYQFMDGQGVTEHLRMSRFFGKWAKPDATTVATLEKEC